MLRSLSETAGGGQQVGAIPAAVRHALKNRRRIYPKKRAYRAKTPQSSQGPEYLCGRTSRGSRMRPSSRSKRPSSPRSAMSAAMYDPIVSDLARNRVIPSRPPRPRDRRRNDDEKSAPPGEDSAEEHCGCASDVLLPSRSAGRAPSGRTAPRPLRRPPAKRSRASGPQKKFRKRLAANGASLDDREVEIEVSCASGCSHGDIRPCPGGGVDGQQIRACFRISAAAGKKLRRMKIREVGEDADRREEAARLVNYEDLRGQGAQPMSSQNGHRVSGRDRQDHEPQRNNRGGCFAAGRGQRDLLPCSWRAATVSTKYGMVKTDHILFIASGRLFLAKPFGPELPEASRGASGR